MVVRRPVTSGGASAEHPGAKTLAGGLPKWSECSVTLAGRLPGLSDTPVTLAGRLTGLPNTPVTLAGRLTGLSKTPVMVAGRLTGLSDPVLRLEAWRRRGRSLRLKLIVEAPAPTGRVFSPTRTNTKNYAQRIQPLSVEECPLRAVFCVCACGGECPARRCGGFYDELEAKRSPPSPPCF